MNYNMQEKELPIREEMVNTQITDFEAFTATIGDTKYDMLYDRASDLVVILGYAPGRHLIYKGHKMNELLQLNMEEVAGHPDAKMCLADSNELETSTPAELFQSIF